MQRLSSRPWTCAIVGSLIVLMLVCSAGVAAVAWLQFRPDRLGATDRIAYVGTDGNIYTIDRLGEDRRGLTQDAEIPTRSGGRLYRFPTWSPDNRQIAFVGVEVDPAQPPTNTLYAASATGDEPKALFSSQDSSPFYLYWAPDARRLAFLANEDDSLALRLAALDGEERVLDGGSPFYFTWSPDSRSLITHVGGSQPAGRIGRLELDGDQPETVLDSPATFLAPAWSPTDDAVLFAAELDEDGSALYLADKRGKPQQALVRYNGAISFAWSPRGDQVAYIVTNQPRPAGLGQFAFGQVEVVERNSENARVVSTEEAIAFFWAPDGQKIAYLSAASDEPQLQGRLTPIATARQQNQFRLWWRVVDLRTGEDIPLANFAPAPGFLSLIPFFDQYAQSLSLWSPDSTAVVYSAQSGADSAEVWMVAVDGQTSPKRIADGDLPVWSWR